MLVRANELIQHVLRNPKSYPGPHNKVQERTSQGLQKLDTHRQLTLIWDAILSRLGELLAEGESVSIQNFGVFTTEGLWKKQTRVGAGHDKVIRRPCFIPSKELKNAVPSWREKQEIDMTDSQAMTAAQSIPQATKFLNEVPIAAGCYLKVDVVKSAMKQIFIAILDLCERKYELEIDMGVCKFIAKTGKIDVIFETQHFVKTIQPTSPYKGRGEKLSEMWSKPAFSQSMAAFIERPKSPEVQAARIATSNLHIMSRDMTGLIRK